MTGEKPEIKFWRELINDHLNRRVPVQYITIGDPLFYVREELKSQYPFEDGKKWNKFDRSPYDHFLAVLRMVLEELESDSPDQYRLGVLLNHLVETPYGFERGDSGTDLVAEYLVRAYSTLSPPTQEAAVKALFVLGRPNTIGFWLQVGHSTKNPQPGPAVMAIAEFCWFENDLIPSLIHMIDLATTGRCFPEEERNGWLKSIGQILWFHWAFDRLTDEQKNDCRFLKPFGSSGRK